ncbi:hypothetical protein CP500_022480 [Tychonema bourrellyi FEM_GT703]|uniref:Uncharacterized protein n=1 Tax=Tychonema bourrellyi FEM_GT703 TaxID=2040638 RepID=A0A2G4EUP3_9CYAN|nr:hypothetical protein CP500_022480 [Tychonema bourrellyi FEM_GT703]
MGSNWLFECSHQRADFCTEIDPQALGYRQYPSLSSADRTYSNPKSFVNFLLPPLSKGRVGVG